jgi:hypothetical protein
VLDVCCVLIFVVIGRASHTKGESLAGIASTSWPFLCGLAVGWAASRAWRRPLALRPAGLAVWLCTVALGMVLRVVSGQGTAVAFIIVALAFLGLFLLGWRVLGRLLTARHGRPRLGGHRRRAFQAELVSPGIGEDEPASAGRQAASHAGEPLSGPPHPGQRSAARMTGSPCTRRLTRVSGEPTKVIHGGLEDESRSPRRHGPGTGRIQPALGGFGGIARLRLTCKFRTSGKFCTSGRESVRGECFIYPPYFIYPTNGIYRLILGADSVKCKDMAGEAGPQGRLPQRKVPDGRLAGAPQRH